MWCWLDSVLWDVPITSHVEWRSFLGKHTHTRHERQHEIQDVRPIRPQAVVHDLMQPLAVELGLVQRALGAEVLALELEPLAALLRRHDASFLQQHGRGHWAVLDRRRVRKRLLLRHHGRCLVSQTDGHHDRQSANEAPTHQSIQVRLWATRMSVAYQSEIVVNAVAAGSDSHVVHLQSGPGRLAGVDCGRSEILSQQDVGGRCELLEGAHVAQLAVPRLLERLALDNRRRHLW